MLTDNGTAFTRQHFQLFLQDWGVWLQFLCAYKPAGNGIVKRSHRSMKTIVALKPEVVYWYNVMPKDTVSTSMAPSNVIYIYNVYILAIDIVANREPQDAQGQRFHQ